MQEEQVANAAVIVHVGSEAKISQAGVLIALMVALRESTLRNLANPTVPESLEYPHEGEEAISTVSTCSSNGRLRAGAVLKN